LHYTFYNQLGISPDERSVIITEVGGNYQANREKIVSILFETFNVQSVYIATTSEFALYSTGKIQWFV
jgi:actin